MPLNRRIVLDDKDINSPPDTSQPDQKYPPFSVPTEFPIRAGHPAQSPATSPATTPQVSPVQSWASPTVHPYHLPMPAPETIKLDAAQAKVLGAFDELSYDQARMFNDFVQLNEIHRSHKIRCTTCGQINFATDFVLRQLKCKSCDHAKTFESIFAEYGR